MFGIQKQYVVLQVTLKEELIGTGSENLKELENIINKQASKGYRLHTMSTASAHSTGLLGGDRIQATLVFEKINSYREVPENQNYHQDVAKVNNTDNAEDTESETNAPQTDYYEDEPKETPLRIALLIIVFLLCVAFLIGLLIASVGGL